jgi:GTP-binding protein
VSATPGKTTLLNAFRLPAFYLVDLPGYGFARASKSARDSYRTLVTRYLRERPSLVGVAWLLDARHDPSAGDFDMQELLVESGRPVLAVLTKADKLGRAARRERAQAIARALELPDDQVQVTSSRTGDGMTDLGASILALVGPGGG